MAKKWLAWGLFLLLLTGCAAAENEKLPVTEDMVGVIEPPEGSLYVPASAIEEQTAGNVKVFALQGARYAQMYQIGEDLLVINDTHMKMLRGVFMVSGEEIEIPQELKSNGWISVGKDGIAYFDDAAKEIVFLNTSLREVSRLRLPETMMGLPQLSEDWQTGYYCTADGIYKIDLHSGIVSLLREQRNPQQSVSDLLCNGKVLHYEAKTVIGGQEILFVDTATGESLWRGEYLEQLVSCGERWYMALDRSAVTEHLVGNGEEVQILWPSDAEQAVYPLLQEQLAITAAEDAGSVKLEVYSLTTGKRQYAADFAGITDVRNVTMTEGKRLLFLAKDCQSGSDVILRWDVAEYAVNEETVYLYPYFTAENPDTEALEALRVRIEELESTYHVNILMWQEAVQTIPAWYDAVPEYVEAAYETVIPLLEKALAQYPENFFQALAEKTGSGKWNICLLRSISADGKKMDSVQFWQGREAYLALSMSKDLEKTVYSGFMDAIDTRVLSLNKAYYEWDWLNPEGFAYFKDDVTHLSQQDSVYLKGETRAFVNSLAMNSESEDREQTMAYACMPNNEALFQAATMQAKLEMLCAGIRDAFDLENYQGQLLWEQYLQTE